MSDVVLLNPKYTDVLQAGGLYYNPPPLDLCWIASALEQNGFKVGVIDLNVESDERLGGYLVRENPKVVGITTPSPALPHVYRLLNLLRQKTPETEVVLFGQHVSGDPRIIASLGVRYGLAGWCERGFADLCKYAIRDEGSMREVDGLLRNVYGRIVENEIKEHGLNELPFPARHLLDIARYKYLTVSASRGCPYKCLHCGSSGPYYPRSREYVLRGPELVVREIRDVVEKHNVRVFDFVDDVFTYDEAHVKELCRLLTKERLGVTWTCSTRPDLITNEIISCMKKAGCMQVCIGVESGSQVVRKRLSRDMPDEVIRNAFRTCRKMGLRTKASALIGLPGESKKEVEDTVEFLRDVKPTYVFLYPTLLLPGSGLFKLALKEGLISSDAWVSYMKAAGPLPIYIPKGMTRGDISRFLAEGNRRLYLSFSYLLQRMSEARSLSDLMEYASFMHGFLERNR